MPTFIPCLLPNVLDFGNLGALPPGDRVGGEAGVCNWPAAAMVTAALTNDDSGGLLTDLRLTIYSMEPVIIGGGPGQPFIPRQNWELVATASGDGRSALPVALGQTVGVGLFFNAPPNRSRIHFSATIEIRTGAVVSATIPVTAVMEAPDVSVEWTLANPFGIEEKSLSNTDPMVGVFHAGHVNDVLVLAGGEENVYSGDLMVGTDDAGVWRVPKPGIGSDDWGAAIPLTDDWDVNAVTCLCQGPDNSDQVFVGTGGAVYETTGFFASWQDITTKNIPFPGLGNVVYKVLVTNRNPRRLVVASDNGVFWSIIPQPGGPYNWRKVSNLTDGRPFPAGPYSGLALGPNDRIVVAAYGANISSGRYGIFYGDWEPHNLRMTTSILPPASPLSLLSFGEYMRRTSLASSPQDPRVIYAVSANLDGSIYAVLASSDSNGTWNGGTAWIQLATPPQQIPGHPEPQNQGWYNNCIAVSPFDSKVVAIGWQKHYVSRDGCATWQVFDSHAGLPALHDDVHAVYFDPTDPPNERLYICSDGGVVLTVDKGQTFDSSFNRYLANLECYGFTVRDNFMACGTQDNGNAYCVIRPGTSPWVRVLDGSGDGADVALIATGQLITNFDTNGFIGSYAARPRTSIPFDVDTESQPPFGPDKTVAIPIPGNGVIKFDPVATPSYPPSGQKMYMVGAQVNTLNVYGLFADLDGNNLDWKPVGSVSSGAPNDTIVGLGALNDGTVLVGTANGKFFLLHLSPSGPVSGQALPVFPPPEILTGQVDHMEIVWSGTLAFATFNFGGGTILRFDGTSWSPADSGLPGGPYNGLAADGYGRIWTCTDDKVFVSRDGFTWKDASFGLPKRPHCRKLRYNFVQQNPPLLYLSTYGHSVWVTGVIG